MAIHLDEQKKTLFTCPFGIHAFQHMPIATFQTCMIAIFSDFIGESLEVFLDDFSVFGLSFDTRVEHLMQILDVCIKHA